MFGPPGKNIFYDYFELKDVGCAKSSYAELKPSEVSIFPPLWKDQLHKPVWEVYPEYVVLSRWQRAWIRMASLNRWKVANGWRKKTSEMFCSPYLQLKKGAFMPQASSYPINLLDAWVVGSEYVPAFDVELFRKHVFLKKDFLIKLDDMSRALNVNFRTIGIHVRQTDWVWAANLELLLDKLKNLNSKTKVFLSTDSAEVVEKVKTVFPDVILQSKFLPKLDSGGLHHYGYEKKDGDMSEKIFFESMADMYLLSRCGVLWHQEGSTFSKFAHHFAAEGQKVVDWSKS